MEFTRSLVCSDIAARGLDIPTLEHVVNYDVPVAMRNYVHRVGRTARAGRSGTAWSLVESQEVRKVPSCGFVSKGRIELILMIMLCRPSISRLYCQKLEDYPRSRISRSSGMI